LVPADVSALPVLGSGREAVVYALDGALVLRRYTRPGDVAAEAAMMRHLAVHGYPVPAVYRADGRDLVMARLTGPTMAQALLTGELDLDAGARLLADLQRRLHRVPVPGSAPPGERILHLDLHPENVLLTDQGPVVIDWPNATTGPPDYDIAVSALILAEVAVGPVAELATAVALFLAGYLRAVGGQPLRMLAPALAKRRRDATAGAADIHLLGPAAALLERVSAAVG
jgi:Ser/Thr protein kinase RdoA (MazF antagonist)